MECAHCFIDVDDTPPQCPHCGERLTWYALRCEGVEGIQDDMFGGPDDSEEKEDLDLLVCLFRWMLNDDDIEEGKCGGVFLTSKAPHTFKHCPTCHSVIKGYALSQKKDILGSTPREVIRKETMKRGTCAGGNCLPSCGPLCGLAECCLEMCIGLIYFHFNYYK